MGHQEQKCMVDPVYDQFDDETKEDCLDGLISSFHTLLQGQLDGQREFFESEELALIRGFEEIEIVRV